MCYALDMFLAWMDVSCLLGVRAEIQAASLSCVRQKAYKPNNTTVTM